MDMLRDESPKTARCSWPSAASSSASCSAPSCSPPTSAPWARSPTSTTSATGAASAPGSWPAPPRWSAPSCCRRPASSRSTSRCTWRRQPQLGGHILGGLMFGFGMVFTGGCPSRNLARAGGGDLRSLLTLVVLGLFAYMAIGGLLAPAARRARAGDELRVAEPTQGLGDIAGASTAGLAAATGSMRRHGRCSPPPRSSTASANKSFRASRGARPLGRRRSASSSSPAGRSPASPTTTWRRKPVPPISLTYVRPTGDALQWLVLLHRRRPCRASARPACSARCSAPSPPRSPWAGSASPPSPTPATRCATSPARR